MAVSVWPAGLPQRWQLPSGFMPPHEPDRRRPPRARNTIASTGTVKTRMGRRTVVTDVDQGEVEPGGSKEGSDWPRRIESVDGVAAAARNHPRATNSLKPWTVLQFRKEMWGP